MGTLLQEQGLQAGELPETWNLKNPEPIIQIHKAYLAAGADIILANTFGANRFKYGEDLEKIVTAGVAKAQTDRIWRAIKKLETFPGSHQDRLEGKYAGKGYKQLLVDNYMAIYKIDETEKTVYVITVQYQRRNM